MQNTYFRPVKSLRQLAFTALVGKIEEDDMYAKLANIIFTVEILIRRIGREQTMQAFSCLYDTITNSRYLLNQELTAVHLPDLRLDNKIFLFLNYLALVTNRILDWDTKKAIVFYTLNWRINRRRYEIIINQIKHKILCDEDWEEGRVRDLKNRLDHWRVCLEKARQIKCLRLEEFGID